MTAGRVALIVTCVLVAALGVWIAISRWEDANKVATAVSALGAVAAVGIAVWAVVRVPRTGRSITIADSGRASATSGGHAVTGVSGKPEHDIGSVRVERTGDATASGGGDAVSGVQLVADADIGELAAAGHSEDVIFEVTVAAAVGAARRSFDASRRAVRGDSAS